MKTVLRNRMLELGRGEEGVALVVTLAVFMFMYIFCAGVFAVGKMVKDRICLQNAADAAAYSAAVVQADTLSRIATINRAMSWTYAQMNKRRMDYIVYRWMEHAKEHYADDRKAAAEWVERSLRASPHYAGRHTCYHGAMGMGSMSVGYDLTRVKQSVGSPMSADDSQAVVMKNPGRQSPVESAVQRALGNYENYFNYDAEIVGSCYDTYGQRGIEGLERQIDADMDSIDRMNVKIRDLRGKMQDRIKIVAREILRANVPNFTNCAYVIKSDRGDSYLYDMENEASQEYRFHEWGNRDIAARRDLHWSKEGNNAWGGGSLTAWYGTGAGKWFRPEWQYLDDNHRPEKGFRWKYTGELTASWTWWAWYCRGCRYTYNRISGTYAWHGATTSRYSASSCDHASDEPCNCTRIQETCFTRGSVLRGYRRKEGQRIESRNDSWILDCRYKRGKRRGSNPSDNNSGEILLRAMPVTLQPDFFTDKGTITVGVARPNANPWRDQYVLGNKDSNIGLYHAFDPFLDWMVCFASARAGYKAVIDGDGREQENRYCPARVANGPRDYCIDFKPIRAVARRVTPKYDERGRRYLEVELVLPTWRQRWNLCQSDWDAVMIPVCRGGSGVFENLDTNFTYGYLREPCWKPTQADYLWNLVVNGEWKGYPLGERWHHFYAGTGQPLDIENYNYIDYAPGSLNGLVKALPERYHGWTENAVQRGGARTIKWPYQWRVSRYGRRLNWLELQKQMLH